jgi:hypothetical protein
MTRQDIKMWACGLIAYRKCEYLFTSCEDFFTFFNKIQAYSCSESTINYPGLRKLVIEIHPWFFFSFLFR